MLRFRLPLNRMAGLVPGIHETGHAVCRHKWIAGTSQGHEDRVNRPSDSIGFRIIPVHVTIRRDSAMFAMLRRQRFENPFLLIYSLFRDG